MSSAKTAGRVTGVLFLAQAAIAILVSTQWITPVRGPGFLDTAADHALQINVALLASFVINGITLAIAIIGMPLFRRYGERTALALLALAIIGFLALAMDTLAVRAMLFLSEEHARAGAPRELVRTLAELARSTWYSAHFTMEMFSHLTYFVLYLILYRSRLVPRALAAAGIAATLLSTTAATMPLLDQGFLPHLVMPMVLIHLTLTAWLIAKGFAESARTPLARLEDERYRPIGNP